MIRHLTTYLMIAMIALQSVAAVADIHQLHQSGMKHLRFDHQHEQDTLKHSDEAGVKLVERADLKSFDCHHCCHCHGIAQFFIGGGHENPVAVQSNLGNTGYRVSYVSLQLSPDNPPPIR